MNKIYVNIIEADYVNISNIIIKSTGEDVSERVLVETIDNKVIFTANNGSNAVTINAEKTLVVEQGRMLVPFNKLKG